MQPGSNPTPPAANQDEEHLRMLTIFFWIYAGLQALAMCCTGGYFLLFGVLFAGASATGGKEAPPAIVGTLFGGIGVVIALVIGAFAFLHYSAGRAIQERRNVTLIYVAAALACLSFPIGTALGVFAFVVLSRPSVKALFT